jgi:hypothetical protein
MKSPERHPIDPFPVLQEDLEELRIRIRLRLELLG